VAATETNTDEDCDAFAHALAQSVGASQSDQHRVV
jgi:hypothetical protein